MFYRCCCHNVHYSTFAIVRLCQTHNRNNRRPRKKKFNKILSVLLAIIWLVTTAKTNDSNCKLSPSVLVLKSNLAPLNGQRYHLSHIARLPSKICILLQSRSHKHHYQIAHKLWRMAAGAADSHFGGSNCMPPLAIL